MAHYKMRHLTALFMLTWLTACSQDVSKSSSDDNFESIVEAIDSLKANGPGHEGVSLNDYFIKDLDNDGVFEIIERSNRIEAGWTGFLNTEIYPAFEYDKIYTLKGDKYVESQTDVAYYLENRLAHYSFWKKAIDNPVNLSSDSQTIIAENKASFLTEIDWIMDEIEKKLKK